MESKRFKSCGDKRLNKCQIWQLLQVEEGVETICETRQKSRHFLLWSDSLTTLIESSKVCQRQIVHPSAKSCVISYVKVDQKLEQIVKLTLFTNMCNESGSFSK